MHHTQVNGTGRRAILRQLVGALLSCAMAAGFSTIFTGIAAAQDTLAPAQQKAMVQCLVGCKKGDAGCQDNCTRKNASPAYFSAAGSCVRACADALLMPGRKDRGIAEDLQKCLGACN